MSAPFLRSLVGPARLCRMDEALVGRIARGEGLGGVALSAFAIVVVGAGAYGFAFGIWRAPEQALYSALKMPAMLTALVLATASVNAMLALLLRAPLGLRQSAVCILVGLATTSAILGALSPVSTFVALAVRGPDLSVLGLPLEDPRADAANRAAQGLLLYHVAVIAIAGVLGNVRLFALLKRLGGRRDIALRVLVAWLGVELLAGSELSWIFRPFLGRPHRVPELVSNEMFDGSFFEEVGAAMMHALGGPGIAVLVVMAVATAATTWALFRADGMLVTVSASARGLDVTADEARFFVTWDRVVAHARRRSTVLFEDAHEIVIDLSDGPARRLLVRFDEVRDADALAERVAVLRDRREGPGPFRSPSVAGA